MNLSFSFLEFGQAALCSESAWFTCVCVRSSIIHDVEGGWPHLLRLFLRRLLLGPSGAKTAGMVVELSDAEPSLIFANLSNILTDGDGFRLAYDWKGHASTRPCLQHYNILRKESVHSERYSKSGVCVFRCFPIRLKLHSTLAIVKRLSAKICFRIYFSQKQSARATALAYVSLHIASETRLPSQAFDVNPTKRSAAR